MVYRIYPTVDRAEVDLEMEWAQNRPSTWMSLRLDHEYFVEEDAPARLTVTKKQILPPAFRLGDGYWCANSEISNYLRLLFGQKIGAVIVVPIWLVMTVLRGRGPR